MVVERYDSWGRPRVWQELREYEWRITYALYYLSNSLFTIICILAGKMIIKNMYLEGVPKNVMICILINMFLSVNQ